MIYISVNHLGLTSFIYRRFFYMKRAITLLLGITIITLFSRIHGHELLQEQEFISWGLIILDRIKMIIGIITIIGAFGLFITNSARRAHWPPYFRRIFFGIFIFCTIIFQIIFNVVNVPKHQELVCIIGACFNNPSKLTQKT